MKKILLISLFSIFSVGMWSQSNIRLNNYWDNLYSINPASINNQYTAMVTIADRKQWSGFEGAPNSVFASASAYIEHYATQVGVKLVRDKIGYTSTSNLGLTYAYAVTLDTEWKLNLGLSGNIHSLSYDLDQINLASTDDPKVYRVLQNANDFNTDIGFEFVSKSLLIGGSSQNFISLFAPEKNRTYPYTNFLYTMYRNLSDNMLDFGFGANAIQNRNLYQMELNTTAYLKNYEMEDLFKFGLFYRTKNEMGAILGANLGNSLYVSYSYDFNLGGISHSSLGTHELMLILKLGKIDNCRCLKR